MKIVGYIRGIKKVHKEVTGETAGRDVLEFKVESLDHKMYDAAVSISKAKLLIELIPEQRSLGLEPGGEK